MNKAGKYLTRITPNEKNWQKPSGCNGKCLGSKGSPLYENFAGFGWEEWLFDNRNRIGEYQYGFLECFNKQNFNIEVNYEEVYLYTRKCILGTNKGEICLVAKICNLKKLSNREALDKEDYFKHNIKIMQNEIPNSEISNHKPTNYIFNTKFKIEDVFFITKDTKISVTNYRFTMIKLDNKNQNNIHLLKKIKEANFNSKVV